VAWACIVGLPAEGCISDHWLLPLHGQSAANGGRAACPVSEHQSDRPPLSIEVKSGRAVWFCHCGCSEETIGKAIAAIVPCYTWSAKRPKRGPDLELARELLLDKTITPNALRIGGLLALGMSMKEITSELKIPRSTYYDAVRILGQRRRSQ
jgi:hypothetical protein